MPADVETLTFALRRVLRRGTPVDPAAAGLELLDLPGVVARSQAAADPAARAHALDGVLRGRLTRLTHPLAPAARILFGVHPDVSGRTLTARRAAAAAASGYEVHHFRKHVEPRICRLLAEQLLADADAFAAARIAAPLLTPEPGTLTLPADVFAWEVAEHEQALCELWSRLYALRAALLQAARLASMESGVLSEDAAGETLWRYAQLREAVTGYRDRYGPVLLPATTPVAPAELAKLAGPLPQLPPQDLALLSTLPADERTVFEARLAEADGGRQLLTTWHHALTKRVSDTRSRRTA